MPGVETETQSSDFWVKHEGGESRFANYDAPALEITRGDEKISHRRERGRGGPGLGRGQRADVLARVELAEPFDGAQIYDPAVTLGWEPPQGAEGYWLEVAADADFNTMQASEWGVRGTSATGSRGWRPATTTGGSPRSTGSGCRGCEASAGAVPGRSTTRRRPSSARRAEGERDRHRRRGHARGRERARARG